MVVGAVLWHGKVVGSREFCSGGEGRRLKSDGRIEERER